MTVPGGGSEFLALLWYFQLHAIHYCDIFNFMLYIVVIFSTSCHTHSCGIFNVMLYTTMVFSASCYTLFPTSCSRASDPASWSRKSGPLEVLVQEKRASGESFVFFLGFCVCSGDHPPHCLLYERSLLARMQRTEIWKWRKESKTVHCHLSTSNETKTRR